MQSNKLNLHNNKQVQNTYIENSTVHWEKNNTTQVWEAFYLNNMKHF